MKNCSKQCYCNPFSKSVEHYVNFEKPRLEIRSTMLKAFHSYQRAFLRVRKHTAHLFWAELSNRYDVLILCWSFQRKRLLAQRVCNSQQVCKPIAHTDLNPLRPPLKYLGLCIGTSPASQMSSFPTCSPTPKTHYKSSQAHDLYEGSGCSFSGMT